MNGSHCDSAPCSARRTYKAYGATIMDEAGCFAVGYGVDVTRAQMIAAALNARTLDPIVVPDFRGQDAPEKKIKKDACMG